MIYKFRKNFYSQNGEAGIIDGEKKLTLVSLVLGMDYQTPLTKNFNQLHFL